MCTLLLFSYLYIKVIWYCVILGVADQLQSNFACDLRNILKCVFDLHTGNDDDDTDCEKKRSQTIRMAQRGMYIDVHV